MLAVELVPEVASPFSCFKMSFVPASADLSVEGAFSESPAGYVCLAFGVIGASKESSVGSGSSFDF